MPNSGMIGAGGAMGSLGNILGGIGGVISSSRDQTAMNAQLAKSLGLLNGYGYMNNQALQKNVANTGFQGFGDARQAGQTAFGNMYQRNPVMGQGGMPTVNYGFAGAAGQARDRLGASNAANMYGFTNAQHQQGLSNLATESALGNNNNLAQASTVPFPALMQQALHSNDMLGALSSLLGTASTVGGQAMMLSGQQAPTAPPSQGQMMSLNQGLGPVNPGFQSMAPNFGITGYGSNYFGF